MLEPFILATFMVATFTLATNYTYPFQITNLKKLNWTHIKNKKVYLHYGFQCALSNHKYEKIIWNFQHAELERKSTMGFLK